MISGSSFKKMKVKRTLALLVAVSMMLGKYSSVQAWAEAGTPLIDKYIGFDGVPVEWKYGNSDDDESYYGYSNKNEGMANATASIDVALSQISDINGNAYAQTEYEGRNAILLNKEGEYAQFNVNAPADGLYEIEIDYYLPAGNSDPGKRILYVDGATPFTECSDITFERFFMDEGEPIINSLGDETRPGQTEVPGWRTTRLCDTSGMYDTTFAIALTKGTHTIQFIYNKVDFYVSGIRLITPKTYKSYEEVSAEYASKGYTEANISETIHFQAELTTLEKNAVTLRRDNDGDPLCEPASDTVRKLNIMGGYRWRTGNQSITWEFEVPEDGLYKIGACVKQMWNDGLPSYRQIEIDGEVPFAELLEYKIPYNTAWNLNTLSDSEGNPYSFYLTKGTHTLTMRVKMGEFSAILRSVKEDIEVLSDILLNITLLASSDPDPNYDYKFFQKIPELKGQMEYLVESMDYKYALASHMSAKTPAMANNFLTVKAQIQSMLDDPFSIARKMGDLESSQENLSNWYISLQSVPLSVDFFNVGTPSEKWKYKSSNFFQKLVATGKQFITSFYKDYDNVGSVLSDDVEITDTITVWIARGTEWAEIIKELADESFTPETGIAINVNVLPSSQLNAGNVNALMLSITSGKAPDVALGVDVTSPVEFAIRDQVYDLSEFEGFEEVKDQFVEATLTPYEYNGGTFAIPETMNFNVLFYRKDILAKFGIDLPQTRQDLYDYVLPALNSNGLEFYFGRDFTQFLFQNGGEFYSEDGLRSALDTPEAYVAFKEYTELFTSYDVPKNANFYQRLRSGIMAMGVGDFNTYMQLSVAAPEIAGKWGIAPLPGVKQEDGTINRAAGAITDKGDVIMKQSTKPEQSWKFLQWWSSIETQESFAKEVEALMGAECRWNTANKEAFLSLAWEDADISTLEEQWKWAQETPTLLGSYMTSRHITNAWTTVVISGGDVREALEQAVKDINREMRSKQEEYGVISYDK